MRNKYIESFEKAQLENRNVPEFRAGDTLRVAVRIKEGEKTRVQNYEGLCIAIRGQVTPLKVLKYLDVVELEELNCSILENSKVKQQESKNSVENSSFVLFYFIFEGATQSLTDVSSFITPSKSKAN